MAEMDAISNVPAEPSASDNHQQRRTKKRVRNFTPDDRALHRVFEKERREAFNGRMLELARLLPRLASVQKNRLSKHVIVEESIEQHKSQRAALTTAAEGIRALLTEREEMLEEINQWRSVNHMALRQPRHVEGAVLDLLKIEQATPSSLTRGFNDGNFDDDEDQAGDSDHRAASNGSDQGATGNEDQTFLVTNNVETTVQARAPAPPFETPLDPLTLPMQLNDDLLSLGAGGALQATTLPVTIDQTSLDILGPWTFGDDSSLAFSLESPNVLGAPTWTEPLQNGYGMPLHVSPHTGYTPPHGTFDHQHVSQVQLPQTNWYS